MIAAGKEQLTMPNMQAKFMSVNCEFRHDSLELVCWISPDDIWGWQKDEYPYTKVYYGDYCIWTIHSNIQLTPKVYEAVTEFADRICNEQQAKNDKRKLVNR